MELDLLLGNTDSPIASRRRLGLLQAIAATGSISRAAQAVGLSYKGAWDAVEAMNNLADGRLVERVTGGKGGGGTRLTAQGERLLALYERLLREQRATAAQLLREDEAAAGDLGVLRRLSVLSSARNQFAGRVVEIVEGAVNDRVRLDIGGGETLVATITRESTRLLGLVAGAPVVALIKASWILLAGAGDAGWPCSADNRLTGTITRITPGAVNAEVALALAGGQTLAAIVTRESVDLLGLAEGGAATGLFDAHSVILSRLD